jgi:lysozyme
LAQTGETRPTSEVADLIVEGGITAWKVKPEFLSQPRVRAQVQQINKNIREDITPSVDVMALGLQISPEQYQSTLFAIDEVGKPQAGGEVSVNASFSRKERREGGKKEEVSKPEPAPVSVEPAPEAPTEPVVSDRLIKHMEKREGRREKSYLDSLGKPTGGIGHLLSKEEQALYPEGTAIPKEVVDAWFTEDIAEAQAAAAEQGAQVPGSTPEFEEALVSMNFQLGTGWTSKFPTAWANMKAGDFIGAAHELEFTSEGSGVQSDWMKQTPVRVKDAKAALVLMQRGTFKK